VEEDAEDEGVSVLECGRRKKSLNEGEFSAGKAVTVHIAFPQQPSHRRIKV